MIETILSDELEERNYEVEFMTIVVDKGDKFRVVDSDSHFSEFAGVHPSKIKQGKVKLLQLLKPIDRERVMQGLCKENARFIYIDFDIFDKDKNPVFVHCTGQNYDDTTLCRLTMADVSKSREKQQRLQEKAIQMNNLIDLVEGGVCLFKVYQNMHIEALYMNEGCCKMFDTSKGNYKGNAYRLDELIYPDDRSAVFQEIGKAMAVGDSINMECRICRHKDDAIWVMLNAGIQSYDEDGCPIFHAIFTDISRVKTAEQKADEETEKLFSLFKNLPGPIFITEPKHPLKAHIVSEDMIKLLGYSRTEFFEFFDGNLAKIMDEDEAKKVEFEIKSQADAGNEILRCEYTIHTVGKGDIFVRDRRRVITHQDGSKVTIAILLSK